MDDLISRTTAIEAFGLSEKTRKYGGDHSGYDTMMLYEIQNTLESLPSAPRWIPVSERLPEPVAPSQRREWFITSNTYGGVTVTCYEFEASPFKEGWQTDMTILAWMPLPKPWKGEEND